MFSAFVADAIQASIDEVYILLIFDSIIQNSHRNNNIIIAKISQSPYYVFFRFFIPCSRVAIAANRPFAERYGFYGRYRAHVIKSDDLVIENGDIVIKFDDNITVIKTKTP